MMKKKRIIHGDFCPANIFIKEGGRIAKLGGFGASRKDSHFKVRK